MKKRILVVEDEDYVSDMLSFALKQEGYEVEVAYNGQKALDILQQKSIDLVVSDIMMPVMDGFELADFMKANLKYMSIPIIFLTARTSEEDQIIGRLKGADDYITKPFDTELLLGAIAARIKWVDKYRTLASEVKDDSRARILSLLSDEFRNPLMSISGAAESLKEHLQDFDNVAVKKFLNIITEQTHNLGRLVDDFLSYSEFELFFTDVKTSSPLLVTLNQCLLANSGDISKQRVLIKKNFPAEEIDIAVPKRSLLRIFDSVLHRLVNSANAEEVITVKVTLNAAVKNAATAFFTLCRKVNTEKNEEKISSERIKKRDSSEKLEIDLYVTDRILQKCGGRVVTQEDENRITSVSLFLPTAR